MKKIIFLLLILSYVVYAQPQKAVLTQKQRDSIQVMINNSIDTTVTGTIPLRTKIVYVEDYGTDEAAIKEAIDSAGTGGVVEFEPNRTYTQTDGIKLNLYDGLTIKGNGATLKRGAQQVTTLTDTVSQYTTVLHVDSVPSGWEIGDELQIYSDSTVTTSSRVVEILSINGLDITLEARVNTNAKLIAMVWDVGDKVRKTYGQIVGTVEYDHHIYDLTFDGNKAENNGNYYFALNEALWIFKKSTVNNCKFINMPNENIFGNGFNITNCYAENLNGSFVHLTGLTTYDLDNFYGSMSNCMTYNTNMLDYTIGGHSEALITFSATAGRFNVHDNWFFNGGEGLFGHVQIGDGLLGASREFIFNNNYCRNFQSISSILWRNAGTLKAGQLIITNNVFDSCGTNDWTDYVLSLELYDTCQIAGNVLSGTTSWTNVPVWTNYQQAFQTGDIVTEDITAEAITSTGMEIAGGDLYIWNPDVLGTELYDFANAISDTSGSEANDDLGWDLVGTPTLSVESTDVQTGTYSLKLTATVNAGVEGMRDSLVLSAGQTYKVSLWAKAGVTADTISQALTAWYNSDNTVIDGSPNGVYVDTVWTKYLYYITPTTDTIFISAYVQSYGTAYGGSIGDELFIDNLSIQKVQGGDIIARGNFGYGNYYFENTPVSAGYVPKTDGNGNVTWSPDISTSGAGLFNPDGITLDTTIAGLAEITPTIKARIDSVWYKQPLDADLTDLSDGSLTLSKVGALQDSLTSKANTSWFTISPTLIDDSITVKMNRSEMTSYSTTTHTHIDFFDTLSYSINVPDTVTTGTIALWKMPNDITITEIAACTDAATTTFNIEERGETTPNSAGTDAMGSDLVADTNQEETSTFTNATISKNNWLALTVSATGDVALLSITIRYIKTD